MKDVYGVGNAIVDVIAEVDDQFLAELALEKGNMTLVDNEHMAHLEDKLSSAPKKIMSGGSAANTVFAVQAFGGSTAYACRLSNDRNGEHFFRDFSESGISMSNSSIVNEGATGQCLVLVTPDAERTMATNLGVSANLTNSCIDEKTLSESKTVYLEGYLATSEKNTGVALQAREIAVKAGAEVALTLSDASILGPFRSAFESFIGEGVEILFCNEQECLNWSGTDRIDLAITEMRDFAKEIYITLGAKGSIVISSAGVEEVGTDQVVAVDTNGAGDMYAGACLFARTQKMTPKECAFFANKCAGAIVQEYGARFSSVTEYRELI